MGARGWKEPNHVFVVNRDCIFDSAHVGSSDPRFHDKAIGQRSSVEEETLAHAQNQR
jgi:hypothetical protein